MVQSRILQKMVAHIDASVEPGDSEGVLNAIDQFAVDSGAAFMHVGSEKGEMIDAVIKQIQPRRVLELGTFFGYSAIRMARLLAADAELVTLEISPRDARTAAHLFEFSGLSQRIALKLGDATETINALDGNFDVVFFDHYAGNYFKDLMAIEAHGLINTGARLIADNVLIHEYDCADYLKHVRDSGGYESQTCETPCRHHGGSVDAIEISRRLRPLDRRN